MKEWHKYSKDHYLFILSQSEKKLSETVTTMNTIQSRGRVQFFFSVSIITSVVGWYISEGHNPAYNNYAMGLLIQAFFSALLSMLGIFKYTISTPGSSSKKLLSDAFYKPFNNPGDAEKNLILSECTDYALRIGRNRRINGGRLRLITFSFILLSLIPVVILLIYLLCPV